jgi:uncharacterized protein YdeI (BOF family)
VPTDPPGPVVLRHARDVHSFAALYPLREASATLSGIVTRRTKKKGRTFLKLRDATGTIQVVLDLERLGDAGWEQAKEVTMSARTTVSGTIAKSTTGELSVFADAPPIVRTGSLDTSIAAGEFGYARVGAQILASRLRERAERHFREAGFVEIEPAFLSASWDGSGLEPLRVRYEGFGGDAYLVPSPSSQLTDALFVTGLERVFSVARCFTTTYRDERSSAEAVLLVAKAADLDSDGQRDLIKAAVTGILGDFETLPEDIDPLLRQWSQTTMPWPPYANETYTTPTFEIFTSPEEHRRDVAVESLTRLVWPPHRVVAEGAREVYDETLTVATITLHLERLVSLLRDIPIRQLRHVGSVGA